MKALSKILLVLVIVYVTSYIVLRSRWTHKWDKDGQSYMHFPVSPGWVYYLYRPVCIADEKISGMRFHIGPHPGAEADEQPAAAAAPAPSK
ncbi:MAG: hypothetical protein K1X78_17330 [Verrucomicrobiaceae bacterium]|nr:hypothetical protein [Verrucomicrobiaceae bacterium]